MASRPIPSPRDRLLRSGGAVAALVFCVALVIGVVWLILNEIDEYSTVATDNLHWGLSQADVDFRRLQLALERAQVLDDLPTDARAETLEQVRRRFDIFFSRLETVKTADAFRRIPDIGEFDAQRREVEGFIDAALPLIDGTDAALASAIDDLARDAVGAGEAVRSLSLTALTAFAEMSDTRRGQLIATLSYVAALLAVLFGGLIGLAVTLARLNRIAAWRETTARTAAGRLKTMVQTSLDGIVLLDERARILEFNTAAERLFGHARADALGRDVFDLLLAADAGQDLRTGALAFIDAGRAPTATETRCECPLLHASGRRFDAEISIDGAEGDGGIVYVAFIRDISRQKEQELALRAARDRALEGERAKATFLAVISHEMRTPLNGLLGSMQLFDDATVPPRHAELLDRMRSSGQLLLGLVNDVLDLSKHEAGKLTAESAPFDLNLLLASVVDDMVPLARQNGDTLTWRWIGPVRGRARGDPRRLRQILLNLVGNAVKFTHGGRIEIEVEALSNGRAEFRVIDTGIGIASGDIDRIFADFEMLDRSFARPAGGTGLGLAIVRRLVSMMKGDLGVESEPGEGSLFWFRLPLDLRAAPDASDTAPPLETPSPRHAGGREVLLIEDSETNRAIAREMIEAEGHAVTEAADGRTGVDLAEARAFDLILMDISMPILDGVEAARTIRAGRGPNRRTPIVALTAHALPDDIVRFEAAGMSRVVAKPIDRRELARVVRAAPGRDLAPAPATATATQASLVDPDQLVALHAQLHPGAARVLFDRFLTEVERDMSLLRKAPPDREIAVVAHRCAGNCATFGATALRRALAEIETRCKRGERPDAETLAKLGRLWCETRTALINAA